MRLFLHSFRYCITHLAHGFREFISEYRVSEWFIWTLQDVVEHSHQGTETLSEIYVENYSLIFKCHWTFAKFHVCIKLLTFLLMSSDAEPSKQILWCASEGFTNKTCHQPLLLMRRTQTFPEHIGPRGCTQCRDHRCHRFPSYLRTQWLENALIHEV